VAAFAMMVLIGAGLVAPQSATAPEARKNPYRSLFTAGPRVAGPTAGHRQISPKPAPRAAEVVCGIRLIPADPAVDPGIRIVIPEATKKQAAIRAIPTPACPAK
jgi:hypothetical protein